MFNRFHMNCDMYTLRFHSQNQKLEPTSTWEGTVQYFTLETVMLHFMILSTGSKRGTFSYGIINSTTRNYYSVDFI